ncbi:MAG: UDP-N-acetylmuramate--L-alanine ligase [Firmicutes bacterium]|nr:UDP-N-acetylmuramate--L-alanine ligase [Bacillota bacterium]
MFENKTVHLIGIGGISMSGIAEILLSLKAKVTGSDISESKITQNLISKGVEIKYGHHPQMIQKADIVVYTAAISDEDEEIKEAKRLKKEMYERAEFLGNISKLYENCLCISGTHGKSTTTSLVSLIFLEANLNPTIQVGAILPQINGNTYIGGQKYLIMESCEYVDSFLHFHPTSEIILNIDNDHLDYFHNLDNIKASFKKYVNLLPKNGFLIINKDDVNSDDIYNETIANVITYGIKNEALYNAKNITHNDLGHHSFDIYYKNNFLININLNINGEHNVYNALAAFALAHQYINDLNTIKAGIEKYRGVERRFELIGKYNNALIYDDYAHHPTEVKTTVESVKKIKHHTNWAIFQSHTFSRTKEHLDEFADVLSNFDQIIIAPIYPARETNTFNVSEEQLVEKIKLKNKNVIYIDSFSKIVDYLEKNVLENDLIITIGAGPINKVGFELKEKSCQ